MNRRQFLKAGIYAGAAAACIGSATGANALFESRPMKILVITGSPRKNGNSNTLAERFMTGAKEAGHSVYRFDAAHSNVHACIACNSCGMDGPCIFDDDFQKVREHIIPADLVAFVTPMYYFGFSSQLKAVIDRFYAINEQIHEPKKAVLLMTYANTSASEAKPINAHYEQLLSYLGWKDAGRVIAPGVWTAGSINDTSYPEEAYKLGRNL